MQLSCQVNLSHSNPLDFQHPIYNLILDVFTQTHTHNKISQFFMRQVIPYNKMAAIQPSIFSRQVNFRE